MFILWTKIHHRKLFQPLMIFKYLAQFLNRTLFFLKKGLDTKLTVSSENHLSKICHKIIQQNT